MAEPPSQPGGAGPQNYSPEAYSMGCPLAHPLLGPFKDFYLIRVSQPYEIGIYLYLFLMLFVARNR